MTCKDCYHYDVCKVWFWEFYSDDMENKNPCPDFKAKSTIAEVVRCKDCKHFEYPFQCRCHEADINGTPIFVQENDFCSYGERKDDADNGKE